MCGLFVGCIRTHAHDRQVTKVTSSCDIDLKIRNQNRLLEAYFKIKVNVEQGKESIICVRVGYKNPPSGSPFATSASLVMSNGDPFYPTLTLMIDSYNLH